MCNQHDRCYEGNEWRDHKCTLFNFHFLVLCEHIWLCTFQESTVFMILPIPFAQTVDALTFNFCYGNFVYLWFIDELYGYERNKHYQSAIVVHRLVYRLEVATIGQDLDPCHSYEMNIQVLRNVFAMSLCCAFWDAFLLTTVAKSFRVSTPAGFIELFICLLLDCYS